MADDPNALSPAAILRRIADVIDPEEDLLRIDLAGVTRKHDSKHHDDPPPRPGPDEVPPETEMVQWLHPKLLLGAAREVVVSGLFARFADKRENQAALAGALVRRDRLRDPAVSRLRLGHRRRLGADLRDRLPARPR